MQFLRNLPTDASALLSGLIEAKNGEVVSMALTKSESIQMTLLAFSAGEGISEECYFGDTLYFVLEGEMRLTFDKKEGSSHPEPLLLCAGDCIAVPANTLHAIGESADAFKLLQITVSQ